MAKRKEFNKGLWCIIVFGVSIVVMISCLSFAFIHNEKQTCGIVEDIRDNKIVIIEDDSEDPDVITIEKPKIIKYEVGKEICYEKKNGEYKHSINIDIDIAMFWGFSLCVSCMFGTVLVRKPKDLLIIIPLCLLASFITAYLSNKNIFYLVPCLFAVPIIVMIIDLSRGKNS